MELPKKSEQPETGYYALELTGKEHGLWQRLRARLISRLKNKMRGFFARRSPRGKTIEAEAHEALESAVQSLQACMAKAALEREKNTVEILRSKAEIEKIRAEIQRMGSESRFNDAKAREAEAHAELLELQARKLDHEVSVQQVQTSVTILEAMIAKGQLHIREDKHGISILVRDVPLLSPSSGDAPIISQPGTPSSRNP